MAEDNDQLQMQRGQPPSPLGALSASPPEQKQDEEGSLSEAAFIKRWEAKATKAKAKFEPDFKRMRKNMEFVTGYQWEGQPELDDPRYSANLTLQMVNRKVAQLYAKNPTVEVTKRPRMDYLIWDESVESLQEAMQAVMQCQMTGMPVPPQVVALLQDFQQGHQHQLLVKRFARTLQILIQYFFDVQTNDFKEQIKQCVRRACICGAAFGRVVYCTANDQSGTHISIPSSGPTHTALDLAERAQLLVEKLKEEDKGEDDPRHEELITYAKSLAASLGARLSGTDDEPLPESFEFDFPLATAVYPDACCRSLTNFVGANAVFIESVLPLDYVNALFGTDVKAGGGRDEAVVHLPDGQENKNPEDAAHDSGADSTKLVCVKEVLDLQTKTHFFICKGWKKFLLAPEPFQPPVNGFWDIATLTFNSIEVDPSAKTSVYPPSDVQNISSIQKEWNRCGNAYRDRRNANAPRWCVRKGTMSQADKEAVEGCQPSQVIELDSIPPDQKVSDWIVALPVQPIDIQLYDKGLLEKDLNYSVGMQEANIGPAKPNVTATVGSIAEQSRVTVTSSNVDDLDSFLSTLARMCGEKAIRVFSKQTVQMICGPGAITWPETAEARKSLLHEVDISIKAASSGRPNKALEVQNAKELGPLMIQAITAAASNPALTKPMSALVEEFARRLDDQIDLTKFFVGAPPPMAPNQQQGNVPKQASSRGGAPSPNRTRNGNPVPRGPTGPNVRQPQPA